LPRQYLVRDRRFFAPDGGFDDNVFYSVPIPLAPFPFEEAGARLKPDDVLILPEVRWRTTSTERFGSLLGNIRGASSNAGDHRHLHLEPR
jgi:hypothetical protein